LHIIKRLEKTVSELEAQIDAALERFRAARDPLKSISAYTAVKDRNLPADGS
jgi:hypothetical protein